MSMLPGVKANVHVCLIMDVGEETFARTCEANPSLYKECDVLWLSEWSEASMRQVLKSLIDFVNSFCHSCPNLC